MNLGASVVIKGEITATENLVIGGRVEGTILVEGGTLTLAAGSTVIGEVLAGAIEVLGQVEGDVVATERIAVRATAVIEGTVKTPLLSVMDGAHINGDVEMPARAEVVRLPVAV